MPATAVAEKATRPAEGSVEDPKPRLRIEPVAKRVRVMFNARTVVESFRASVLMESGHLPVYYFPREDVRMDFLQSTSHRSRCPLKGEASYWTLEAGARAAENAVWSYEHPLPGAAQIAGRLAFFWDKADNWFEEDEEVFGHPHDPHHLIDIRASTRPVRVLFGGERVAFTRRALFLFETGLPVRYYIPHEDVRLEFLKPSSLKTTCAYKGEASYWSLSAGRCPRSPRRYPLSKRMTMK